MSILRACSYSGTRRKKIRSCFRYLFINGTTILTSFTWSSVWEHRVSNFINSCTGNISATPLDSQLDWRSCSTRMLSAMFIFTPSMVSSFVQTLCDFRKEEYSLVATQISWGASIWLMESTSY